MKNYNPNLKIVLMPILVPANGYCWNGHISCDHFDNEGGHPTCTIGISIKQFPSFSGVKKPNECLNFKETENDTQM